MVESHSLLGGITSIIEPDVYTAGRASLLQLAKDHNLVLNPDALAEVLPFWNIPYNALSIISNRVTPLHRDMFGRSEWMDFLVALGQYSDGRIDIPGLGLRFRYDPGCVVAFSGKLLRHGVTCPGDRGCIAYYMRDTVQERLGQQVGGWQRISDFGLSIDVLHE